MSEQERRSNIQNQDNSGQDPNSEASNSEDLESRRQAGADLLQAGDAIIEGLLSGNSQAFLRNSQQRGGQ
jgi:hypothetical protein